MRSLRQACELVLETSDEDGELIAKLLAARGMLAKPLQ
jgi:hypothetical protein